MASVAELYGRVVDLATNPKHSRWQSPVLLAFDALLCFVIIQKVPCMYYAL
jgi:alpha-1,3-mannosyltransferase